MRLLLATGFCGGFTTLSSMIYETNAMFRDSEYLHAMLYIGSSIIFSVLAFFVGVVAVRTIIRTGGGLWN
jgi:CrcB protein